MVDGHDFYSKSTDERVLRPRSVSAGRVQRILFITPFLDDNSTGRTYSLWLIAKHLGWETEVVSFYGSDDVWGPVSDTDFAKDCRRIHAKWRFQRVRRLRKMSSDFTAVVAVKPLPQTLGIALAARRFGRFPLLLDIDDPDIESRLTWHPVLRALVWRIRFFRYWLTIRQPKRLASRVPVMVSNPELSRRYGGEVVPHARVDPGPGAAHHSEAPVIAFIGTARAHKGVEVLRSAVDSISWAGFSLVITAQPPKDARPWESWVGETTLPEGIALVASADLVVIPSLDGVHSRGQLPVKLVDAMLTGRAVIVSDVEPLPWAVGSMGGAVVAPGDASALAEALLNLRPPEIRAEVGEAMRERALRLFTPDECAPSFERAVRRSQCVDP